MRHSIAALALLGVFTGVATGGIANAQQADAPAPTETADAQTAPAAPEGPSEKIVAVHKDWQIRCRDGEKETDCFMYQLAKNPQGAPIAEISVVRLDQPDGAVAGVTIITPLRSLLTQGIGMKIDNNPIIGYPYLWCAEVGCFVQYGLTAEELAGYKRGVKAELTVVPYQNRANPVTLGLSLAGFTAAYNALNVE